MFLRKKTRQGIGTDPIIVGMMIVVGIALLGAVAVTVMPLINKSKDATVQENLKALQGGIEQYMTNSNSEAPCFDPTIAEGTNTVANTSICYQNGSSYDFAQGVETGSGDLDKDGNKAEIMTPFSILVPTYVKEMPKEVYSGEPFIYTKGLNDSNTNASAFAVSGLLHSENANATVKQNVSVIDAIAKNTSKDAGGFTSSATACRAADVQGNGKFTNRDLAKTSPGELGGYHYYGVSALTKANFLKSDCDVYSQGTIMNDAFSGDATEGGSPSITINSTTE